MNTLNNFFCSCFNHSCMPYLRDYYIIYIVVCIPDAIFLCFVPVSFFSAWGPAGLRSYCRLCFFVSQPYYPVRMRRDKVICLSVCRHHENRQISTSRHLSDSKVQRICRSWRKTGSRMLKIEWYSLQVSQIVYFSWPS